MFLTIVLSSLVIVGIIIFALWWYVDSVGGFMKNHKKITIAIITAIVVSIIGFGIYCSVNANPTEYIEYDDDDYKEDMNDWYANQAEGKDYNYNDGGSYYCMGKNDTCSRKTNNAYDLFCGSCDPDGDNVEG